MFGSVQNASISGPYRISGKFLLLPISGSGHSNIFFGNYQSISRDLRTEFRKKVGILLSEFLEVVETN